MKARELAAKLLELSINKDFEVAYVQPGEYGYDEDGGHYEPSGVPKIVKREADDAKELPGEFIAI
jgi:hypothetical protein